MTYGGGITITDLGNGGINLLSNPSGGSGFHIYTGTNYAGLPITANINTPAWGYTNDGNIYFNNGAGWVAWTGLNSKEVLAQASPGATPTLNTDAYGVFHFTVVSTDITSMTTNLSGTPVDGDSIRISFTDNGTARAITWGLGFEDASSTLPHSTIATIRLDVGFIWDSETNKWRCVASTIPNFTTGLTTASAPGAVNSDGSPSTTSPAKADHQHAREPYHATPSTSLSGDVAFGGTANTVARGDHKHKREVALYGTGGTIPFGTYAGQPVLTQRGALSGTTNSLTGALTLTFPVAFPNGVFSVQLISSGTNPMYVGYVERPTITKTGCTVRLMSFLSGLAPIYQIMLNAGITMDYVAVGF